MFYKFQSRDAAFNESMRSWQWQAIIRYLLAVVTIVGAPILAGAMARFVSSESLDTLFVSATIGSWERTYFLCFLFIFLLVEISSWAMVQLSKETKKKDYRAGALLRPLIEKANLALPVRILELKEDDRLNAGALRSFAYGRKVLLMGDTSKLTKEELRAVLAHEVAHLAMRDVRFGHILLALRLSVRVLNLMILGALMLTWLKMDFELFWFLSSAFIITLLGSRVARMLYLSYSRVCEYRADAIAVEMTTDKHRKLLISAVMKVREIGLMVMLRKKEKEELDWDKTHPSIKNRAKALGLVIRDLSSRLISAS